MNFKLTKGSLNFKVYTSPTIPASGAENDIVIISSTPMENWILSSDSPTGEPRNNGDVWVQYSVSGNVFDIMNQHDFMLAITRIYQYISGIWMSVDASRYVGGVWDVVSSAFSATINVTYPAGSTCTATDGTTTLTAPDTSGTWVCVVPNTGTWTVSCTNGDKTKSKSVNITTEGQAENVTLTYELALFDGGSVNEDITGGWLGNMAQDQLGTDSYLYLRSYGYNNASAVTVNKITVTEYNTLKVNVTAYTRNDANAWVGLSSAANEASYKSPVLKISPTASETPAEYSGDLSALSGEYYVFVFAEGYFDNVPAAHTCNIKIDKIILA